MELHKSLYITIKVDIETIARKKCPPTDLSPERLYQKTYIEEQNIICKTINMFFFQNKM
jgi:hypothetical protein